MMDASVSTPHGRVTPRRRLDRKARNRAFQRLYDHHFRLVWSVVRGGGVPAAQCEDVAQEVWIQVHRLLHRLRDDASERAWLVAIARKRVLQHHRAHHRRQRRELAWGESNPGETDGDRARVEAKSVVARMLDRMNEEQRLTFVLVHGYGLTGEEVAAAVGDSVNTVYSRLRLARRHVRRIADAAKVEERRVARTLWSAAPPRRTERRMWAGMAGQLGMSTGLLGGSTLGMGAGSLAATLGIAATGLVLLRIAVVPDPAPDPRPASVAVVAAEAEPPAARSPSASEGTSASVEPVIASAAASAALGPSVDPTPRRRAASDPTPKATPASTLAAEAALLKDAKQALNRNAPAEALTLLDEHARRYPDGTLEDVRRGARIRALCALGRAPQARGEALLLAGTRKDSVVAAGVEDVCRDARPGRGGR